MTWDCDLWPQCPPAECAPADGSDPPREALFPSARRAIMQTLSRYDEGGQARIGYPPFVSPCVARAIKTVATPVCTRDFGLDDYSNLDGLLVHEQWGWPLAERAIERVATGIGLGRLVVIDRVDSADYFRRTVDARPGAVEIVSLSKTLGLLGGGLARDRAGDRRFDGRPMSATTTQAVVRVGSSRHGARYREFFKNNDQVSHPAVTTWLATHSIRQSMELERVRRQGHVNLIRTSRLADGWPGWMHEAVGAGAGPTLAPILRGHDPQHWASIMRLCATEFGVASTVALFNWTGDPFAPSYEPCVMIPVHGEMRRLPEIVPAAGGC